jgi:hypothetical protein
MTQREQVLHMLERAGERGVTTADFLQAYMPRFSARIKELRDAGHRIDTERVGPSSSRYTLHRVQQPGSVKGERERSTPRAAGSRAGSSDRAIAWPTSTDAAASSGMGNQDPAGGDGTGSVAALPTLFDVEPPRPRSHYEEEAA